MALFNNVTIRGRMNINSEDLVLNGRKIFDYFLPAGTTEINHALKSTKLDNAPSVAYVRFGSESTNYNNSKTVFAWNESDQNYQLGLVISSIPSSAVDYVYSDLVNTINTASSTRKGLLSQKSAMALENISGYLWSEHRLYGSSLALMPKILKVISTDNGELYAIGTVYSSAVGIYSSSNKLVKSTDGQNWSIVEESTFDDYYISDIAYGNGNLIVVCYADNDTIFTAIRNEENPTFKFFGLTETFTNDPIINYSEGKFLLIYDNKIRILESSGNSLSTTYSITTGNVGTDRTADDTANFNNIAYGDGLTLLTTDSVDNNVGYIYVINNTKTIMYRLLNQDLYDKIGVDGTNKEKILYNNGNFYMIHSKSTTPTTKYITIIPTSYILSCIHSGEVINEPITYTITGMTAIINYASVDGKLYALSSNGSLHVSIDGKTWIKESGSGNEYLYNKYSALHPDKSDLPTFSSTNILVHHSIVNFRGNLYRILQNKNAVYIRRSGNNQLFNDHTHSQYATLAYIEEMLRTFTGNTTGDLSDTYLTKTLASSTYLTKSTASSTYLTKTVASSTYLTKTDAANDYAKKDHTHDYEDEIGMADGTSNGLMSSDDARFLNDTKFKGGRVLREENLSNRYFIKPNSNVYDQMTPEMMNYICKGGRYYLYLYKDTTENKFYLYKSIDGVHFTSNISGINNYFFDSSYMTDISVDNSHILYDKGYFFVMSKENYIGLSNNNIVIINENTLSSRTVEFVDDGTDFDNDGYIKLLRVIRMDNLRSDVVFFLGLRKKSSTSTLEFVIYSYNIESNTFNESTNFDLNDYITTEMDLTYSDVSITYSKHLSDDSLFMIRVDTDDSSDNTLYYMMRMNMNYFYYEALPSYVSDEITESSLYSSDAQIYVCDMQLMDDKCVAVYNTYNSEENAINYYCIRHLTQYDYFERYLVYTITDEDFINPQENNFINIWIETNVTRNNSDDHYHTDECFDIYLLDFMGGDITFSVLSFNDREIVPDFTNYLSIPFPLSSYEFHDCTFFNITSLDYNSRYISFIRAEGDSNEYFTYSLDPDNKVFDHAMLILNGALNGYIHEGNINSYIQQYIEENGISGDSSSSATITVSQITDINTYYHTKTEITTLLKNYASSTHKHALSDISGLAQLDLLSDSYTIEGNSVGNQSESVLSSVDGSILSDKGISDFIFNNPNIISSALSDNYDFAVAENGDYIVYEKVKTFTEFYDSTNNVYSWSKENMPHTSYLVFDKNNNKINNSDCHLPVYSNSSTDEFLRSTTSGVTLTTKVEILKDVVLFFMNIQDLATASYRNFIVFKFRDSKNASRDYVFDWFSGSYTDFISGVADISTVSNLEFEDIKYNRIFYFDCAELDEHPNSLMQMCENKYFHGAIESFDVNGDKYIYILTGEGILKVPFNDPYEISSINYEHFINSNRYLHCVYNEFYNDPSTSLMNKSISAIILDTDTTYELIEYRFLVNEPFGTYSITSKSDDFQTAVESSDVKYFKYDDHDSYLYYYDGTNNNYIISEFTISSSSNSLVENKFVDRTNCRLLFYTDKYLALVEKSDNDSYNYILHIIRSGSTSSKYYINSYFIRSWINDNSSELISTKCNINYKNGRLLINNNGQILSINEFSVNDLSAYAKFDSKLLMDKINSSNKDIIELVENNVPMTMRTSTISLFTNGGNSLTTLDKKFFVEGKYNDISYAPNINSWELIIHRKNSKTEIWRTSVEYNMNRSKGTIIDLREMLGGYPENYTSDVEIKVDNILFCKDRFVILFTQSASSSDTTLNERFIAVIMDKEDEYHYYINGVDYFTNKLMSWDDAYINGSYAAPYIFKENDTLNDANIHYDIKNDIVIFEGKLESGDTDIYISYNRCNSFISIGQLVNSPVIYIDDGCLLYVNDEAIKKYSYPIHQEYIYAYNESMTYLEEINSFTTTMGLYDYAVTKSDTENVYYIYDRGTFRDSIASCYKLTEFSADATFTLESVDVFSIFEDENIEKFKKDNNLSECNFDSIRINDLKICNGLYLINASLYDSSSGVYYVVTLLNDKVLNITSFTYDTYERFSESKNGYSLLINIPYSVEFYNILEFSYDKYKDVYNTNEFDSKYPIDLKYYSNVSRTDTNENNTSLSLNAIQKDIEMIYYNGLYVKLIYNFTNSVHALAISKDGLNWKSHLLSDLSIVSYGGFETLSIYSIKMYREQNNLCLYTSNTSMDLGVRIIKINDFFNSNLYDKLDYISNTGIAGFDYSMQSYTNLTTMPEYTDVLLRESGAESYFESYLQDDHLGLVDISSGCFNIKAINQAIYDDDKDCTYFSFRVKRPTADDTFGVYGYEGLQNLKEIDSNYENYFDILVIYDCKTSKFIVPQICFEPADYYETRFLPILASGIYMDRTTKNIIFNTIIPDTTDDYYVYAETLFDDVLGMFCMVMLSIDENNNFSLSESTINPKYNLIKVFNNKNQVRSFNKDGINVNLQSYVDPENGNLSVLYMDNSCISTIKETFAVINTQRSNSDSYLSTLVSEAQQSVELGNTADIFTNVHPLYLSGFGSTTISTKLKVLYQKVIGNYIYIIADIVPYPENSKILYGDYLGITNETIILGRLPLRGITEGDAQPFEIIRYLSESHLPFIKSNTSKASLSGIDLSDDSNEIIKFYNNFSIHETDNGIMISLSSFKMDEEYFSNLSDQNNANFQYFNKDINEVIKIGDYDLEKDK